MTLCFLAFCCNGVLFANVNAMAMQSLGRVAGLGASMIASLSSLVAVIISVVLGRFYDMTLFPLAGGLLLAGVVALALVLAPDRKLAADVCSSRGVAPSCRPRGPNSLSPPNTPSTTTGTPNERGP